MSGPHGVLYGTLAYSVKGSPNQEPDTVFSLTPPASKGGKWTLQTLWDMTSPQSLRSRAPVGPLFFRPETGTLYGVDIGFHFNGVFVVAPPVAPGSPWRHAAIQKNLLERSALGLLSGGVLYGTDLAGVWSLVP